MSGGRGVAEHRELTRFMALDASWAGVLENGDPFRCDDEAHRFIPVASKLVLNAGQTAVNDWQDFNGTTAKIISPTGYTDRATVHNATPYWGIRSPTNHYFALNIQGGGNSTEWTFMMAYTVLFNNSTTTKGNLFHVNYPSSSAIVWEFGSTSGIRVYAGQSGFQSTFTRWALNAAPQLPNTTVASDQNKLLVLGLSCIPNSNEFRVIGKNGILRVNNTTAQRGTFPTTFGESPSTAANDMILYPPTPTFASSTALGTLWINQSWSNNWLGTNSGIWNTAYKKWPGSTSGGPGFVLAGGPWAGPGGGTAGSTPAATSVAMDLVYHEIRVYKRPLDEQQLVAAYADILDSVQSRPSAAPMPDT